LASMAPENHVGCREKVQFLRAYLGVRKLRQQDKSLVRCVLRKLASIRRRVERKNAARSSVISSVPHAAWRVTTTLASARPIS
jgi:hypothetical protein